MRFTKAGRTMGDETSVYAVTDYQAKTVVEFMNEVIKERPNEWGCFNVKSKNGGFLFCKHVEYKYGKLLSEIYDEWQYVEIEKIEACGGWSRMDYHIYPKRLEQ